MLIKVKCGGTKKYVKMEEVNFSDFISAVQQKFLIPESTPLKVTNEQGIEVDEDVFPELATAKEVCFVIYTDNDAAVLQQESEGPSSPSLTDTLSISSSLSSNTSDAGFQMIQPVMEFTCARNTVEQILTSKPVGMTVIKEYEDTGSLKDSTRQLLVNIIVAHMHEKEGRAVSKATKEFHAFGIVSLFPFLKDPYSKKGYEHFYDMQSNKGFIEWHIKTVHRQSKTPSASRSRVELKGGPTLARMSGSIDDQQTGDECMEAMSLLHHITDRDLVFQKMKDTFHYRQKMLHDPKQSADILQMFPRFLDTKGQISQDFSMMFGAETASRFLEKWNTSFKDKVIQEARTLRGTSLLKKQLKSALNEESDTADEPEWDSDMASLLVLLHLLTPQPAGRKRPRKISVGEATDHLVKFHKSCHGLEEHLMTIEGNPQPYLLATGTSKAQVFSFYIVLDRKLLPCQSSTSLGAFDELFKSHFVFSVQYDDALLSLYGFLQTTLYNIDIGTTEETPRVKELRAKLLNKQ
ncbi:uncharacterized protein LOC117952118 [Etheostoma cragini]|uniref:uncharacterized protein LOC117952118 n=1 Tax=Etheostoma cragini TaxID=417921 RepID=UPI00155E501B|nr:uncharacterized protein LOC117952118 [Etheostoma cragini]